MKKLVGFILNITILKLGGREGPPNLDPSTRRFSLVKFPKDTT